MAKRTSKSRAKGPEDTGTVSRVEKVGPIHARGLRDLAGLGINIRQGEPYDRMRVDFELSCGSASLRVGAEDYVLSLRMCHVRLEQENGQIIPLSRYEHRLGRGSFEVSGTETQSSSLTREVGFGIEGSVDASPMAPKLTAWVKGHFKRGTSKDERKQEVVRRQARTDLVVTSGQDRWQVGDPVRGDARRHDTRLLGTYFGEEQDEAGEPKPLCLVSRITSTSPLLLTASASVTFGQMIVERNARPADEAARKRAEAALRPSSGRAVREHAAAKTELRSRLAGLVVAQALGDAQRQAGLPLADGEVMIAAQSLGVSPSQETCEEHTADEP